MNRTGKSKFAVVGWGRGMGHKGHMYLADAVITQAINMKADPYFFVSKTVGKDDPIFPEEKVRIYQKVFPQYANIFEPQGNLNQALADLANLGYIGVVVVVGADQKKAFQYLERPDKSGKPVYQNLGLKTLKVISRQETNSKFADEEGPRATPMREILLDPNASEEDKFAVWRRDMPEQLGDRDVLDIMNKAESRLVHDNAPKMIKSMSKKAAKLKEAIINFRLGKSMPKDPNAEKEPELLGYQHLFKQPDQTDKPVEKQYHGWSEYEKEMNPEQKPDEVEEARIIDPKALINAFYVSPEGRKHRVAERIPYYLLDKLVPLLTKKYAITMNDIEVRPADVNQYRRSSSPDLAEGKFNELSVMLNDYHNMSLSDVKFYGMYGMTRQEVAKKYAHYLDKQMKVNEFAFDDEDDRERPKYLPWNEFIGDLEAILGDHFAVKQNIVKSTIKARFVPHDPMEFGPTMLYSYYETRAGRNKGAISTRGSIQVGKYTKGGLFGHTPDQLLTGFHLLKGHPFERHFDLTGENVQKIADIIIGNTQGALEFKPEGVSEGVDQKDSIVSKFKTYFRELKSLPGFVEEYKKISNNKELLKTILSDIQKTSVSSDNIVSILNHRIPTDGIVAEGLDDKIAEWWQILMSLIGLLALFYGKGETFGDRMEHLILFQMIGAIGGFYSWMKKHTEKSEMDEGINRRGFLKGLGATVGGIVGAQGLQNHYDTGDWTRSNRNVITRGTIYTGSDAPKPSIKNISSVSIGDSENTVRSLLGKPFDESVSNYQDLEIKRWIYKGKSMFGVDAVVIVFNNGKVYSISKPENTKEGIEQGVEETKVSKYKSNEDYLDE